MPDVVYLIAISFGWPLAPAFAYYFFVLLPFFWI